jgi:hypothetical protein
MRIKENAESGEIRQLLGRDIHMLIIRFTTKCRCSLIYVARGRMQVEKAAQEVHANGKNCVYYTLRQQFKRRFDHAVDSNAPDAVCSDEATTSVGLSIATSQTK